MARQRRITEAGALHHITARGVDKCDVFLDDGDRRQFLALLSECTNRFGCKVLAFCLMTNHIHLTIRDDLGSLSRTLHLLNGVYAKRFNYKHGRTGHLFERRFWNSQIGSDAYLTQCAAYVHRNPLEAGMVKSLEDYRWSSYPSYLGQRPRPDFLDTEILLDLYGGDLDQLRAETELPLGDTVLISQLRSVNPPTVLGEETQDSTQPRRTTPTAKRSHSLEDVIVACATVTGVEASSITSRLQGRPNPGRNLAAFVAQRHSGFTLKEIAAVLNSTPAAVSAAQRRYSSGRKPAPNNDVVERVLDLLQQSEPTC